MIVSRSDNGILVRIPNGELAEIEGYVMSADMATSVSTELPELHAIKRWVDHLLRLAEHRDLSANDATPNGSTVRAERDGSA